MESANEKAIVLENISIDKKFGQIMSSLSE